MNPNFKPEMITPKLLKACGDQVSKYFYGPMDGDCLICDGTQGDGCNCKHCPLGDGLNKGVPCTKDPTFIYGIRRHGASKERLLARGNRLIEILDQHGIAIYDKEVK